MLCGLKFLSFPFFPRRDPHSLEGVLEEWEDSLEGVLEEWEDCLEGVLEAEDPQDLLDPLGEAWWLVLVEGAAFSQFSRLQ